MMASTSRSGDDGPLEGDTGAAPVRTMTTLAGVTPGCPDFAGRPPAPCVRRDAGCDLVMWVDRRVKAADGDSLGISVGVYVDAVSRQPAWLIIDTGLAGTPLVVAPVPGSSLLGDDIVVGADRDAVLSAPTVADLVPLDTGEVRSLTAHYDHRAAGGEHPSRRRFSPPPPPDDAGPSRPAVPAVVDIARDGCQGDQPGHPENLARRAASQAEAPGDW